MTANKVALVTGASSGIGEAISKELVRRGWQVIGIARSIGKLDQLQKELSDSFIPVVCDVSQKEQIVKASSSLLDKGLIPSHLFLNAGVTGESAVEKPNQFDLEIHEKIMNVNYIGVLAWIKFWEKPCLQNGGANFIVTSSINAIFAPPTGSAYAASKAAVAKAFEGLSLSYHNSPLKFSIVYPGPVDTLGRKGKLPFTWSAERMGKCIVDGAIKGRSRYYPSLFYRLLAQLLNALPAKYTIKILRLLQ
jgi:3-hydroxy acid dehydrogenase / malonic semialdehyde reductase